MAKLANVCEKCGSSLTDEGAPLLIADRVEISGQYENGKLLEFKGHTIDWIMAEWRNQLSQLPPDPKGPTTLLPAVVYCGKQILREVGETPLSSYPIDVEDYCRALAADPDISRLLMEQYFISDEEVKEKALKRFKALGVERPGLKP